MLNEAAPALPSGFVLYWVDGGLPEVFSEPSFDPPAAVFNSRYLEVSAFMRKMVDFRSSEIVTELSERVCLRLMAELALRYDEPSLAAYLLTKGVLDQGLAIGTGNTLLDLEYLEKDETYMAVWFFAILHELGHLANEKSAPNNGGFPPRALLGRQVDEALQNFLRAKSLDQSYIGPELANSLDLDHLADEAASDLFAVGLLLICTQKIMEAEGGPAFRPLRFAYEVVTMLNVYVATDICRRTVRVASTFPIGASDAIQGLLTPVAVGVRVQTLLHFLAVAFATMEAGGESNPDRDLVDGWVAALSGINSSDAEVFDKLESGQAKAMRQVLFPTERVSGLARRLRESMASPSGAIARVELTYFCQLADSLGIAHPDIDYLRQLVENVSAPQPVERPYLISWVDGPGGFSSPFILDTRYGGVVFVFHGDSRIFSTFHTVSKEWVKSGFTLRVAAIVAESEFDVPPILIRRLPPEIMQQTVVAMEGTGRFEKWMDELTAGTIWPD